MSSIIDKIARYNGPMPLIWTRDGAPMSEPLITLDEQDDHIDHVDGLNTTLYPHQRTSLKALIDMENTRTINLQSKMIINGVNTLNAGSTCTYNEAVFSDPVGSGKTIVMLALIIANKTPRRIAEIREYNTPPPHVFTSYIRIKHCVIARPTVIFVSRAILNQWVAAIKQFTKLTYLLVNNTYALRRLCLIAKTKELNNFDIILIKNGTVSDQTKGIKAKGIYNQIAELGICWNRVVLDDYTNITMDHYSQPVRGVFTWYMAATRIYSRRRPNRLDVGYIGAFAEYFKLSRLSHPVIKSNEFLFGMLNVRSSPDYIKESIAMPHIKFWVIRVTNPNDRYIAMISAISGDRASAIGEMLSGDAIGEAAKAAGIEADSVADIFGKLLDRQYSTYRFAGDLLAYIEHLKAEHVTRKPLTEWTPADSVREPTREHPDAHLKPLYGKKELLEFKPVDFEYANINNLLDTVYAEYTEIKKNVGKAIDRVKSNIDNNECIICYELLSKRGDSFITKCCNAMFCGTCGFTAQRINMTNRLTGVCSNCRAPIKIEDLIYVASIEMLNKVKAEEFDDNEPQELPLVQQHITHDKKSKFDHIIDIIKSNGNFSPTCAERAIVQLPNIMNGAQYMPEKPARKVLIFANYGETLQKAMAKLQEEKILFFHLHGTASEITATAAKFTAADGPCALVINSTKHCAGLNLQTATDLIFTHCILDSNIESQVAGRGHRIGRTSPLNIWYLTYKTEYDNLCANRNMRMPSMDELAMETAPLSELLIDQLNGQPTNKTASKPATHTRIQPNIKPATHTRPASKPHESSDDLLDDLLDESLDESLDD
jgi:hypothetical protein